MNCPFGFVIIDKPSGLTSHDCVNRLRSVFGIKRVGHGGTLDGRPLGCFGDLGISSPRKLLQTENGGILYLRGKQVEPKINEILNNPSNIITS